jgi:hypothetical protein
MFAAVPDPTFIVTEDIRCFLRLPDEKNWIILS